MQGSASLSIEEQAAELVDYVDLQGFALTYSAALYLCRLIPDWKARANERLRKALAFIGISLTQEQATEALERLADASQAAQPEVPNDWELSVSSNGVPETQRIKAAFFEASRRFANQVERALPGRNAVAVGLIKPTTAGVTVLPDARDETRFVRLRCMTRPLTSRILTAQRQHIAENVRRRFEESRHGWLDGVCAMTLGASTAGLGMGTSSSAKTWVESRIFAELEAHAKQTPLPEDWLPGGRSSRLKLFAQIDDHRTVLSPEHLRTLAARYRNFVESSPASSFVELRAKLPHN